MQRLSQLGATILGLLVLAQPALAFCGFYVTKADTHSTRHPKWCWCATTTEPL